MTPYILQELEVAEVIPQVKCACYTPHRFHGTPTRSLEGTLTLCSSTSHRLQNHPPLDVRSPRTSLSALQQPMATVGKSSRATCTTPHLPIEQGTTTRSTHFFSFRAASLRSLRHPLQFHGVEYKYEESERCSTPGDHPLTSPGSFYRSQAFSTPSDQDPQT